MSRSFLAVLPIAFMDEYIYTIQTIKDGEIIKEDS